MRRFDRAQCVVKKSIKLLCVHGHYIGGVVKSCDVKIGMRVRYDWLYDLPSIYSTTEKVSFSAS